LLGATYSRLAERIRSRTDESGCELDAAYTARGAEVSVSGIIEVAIGLILVFLLLSLLTSSVNELAGQVLKRRAKYLEQGIRDLLGDAFATDFYRHPLVAAFRQKDRGAESPNDSKRKPAYIPSELFSRTVVSILTDASTTLAAPIPQHDAGSSLDMTIDSTLGFPPTPGFQVRIDDEVFRVDELGGPKNWRVTSAFANTAPTEHKAGARVSRVRSQPPSSDEVLQGVTSAIERLPDPGVRDALRAFLTTADKKLDRWQGDIEKWFDDKMERVSGWYKRKTKLLLFLWGLLLAIMFNADTILLTNALWNNDTLRESVVAQAERMAQAPAPAVTNGTPAPEVSASPCPVQPSPAPSPPLEAQSLECVATQVQNLEALKLPLGWPDLAEWSWSEWSWQVSDDARVWQSGSEFIVKILGLLLTAFALTFGAPFWFDLLNKFVNFRASGAPPPPARKAEEEPEA
jgi:hypothetical protein